MKHCLVWRPMDRETLATHLGSVDILASNALDDTTVYRCRSIDGESIAVALSDGTGILIATDSARPPLPERRRGSNSPLDE